MPFIFPGILGFQKRLLWKVQRCYFKLHYTLNTAWMKELERDLYQMTSKNNLCQPLRLNIPRHDSLDLLLLPYAPLLGGAYILQEGRNALCKGHHSQDEKSKGLVCEATVQPQLLIPLMRWEPERNPACSSRGMSRAAEIQERNTVNKTRCICI